MARRAREAADEAARRAHRAAARHRRPACAERAASAARARERRRGARMGARHRAQRRAPAAGRRARGGEAGAAPARGYGGRRRGRGEGAYRAHRQRYGDAGARLAARADGRAVRGPDVERAPAPQPGARRADEIPVRGGLLRATRADDRRQPAGRRGLRHARRGGGLGAVGARGEPARARQRGRADGARRRVRADGPHGRGQDDDDREARGALRDALRREQGRAAHDGQLPDRRPRATAHLRQDPRRAGARGEGRRRSAARARRAAQQSTWC